MRTFQVKVGQIVDVTVDETKFNEEFMSDFRSSFYDFEVIEDHVRHLAQLYARNMLSHKFVEGYGLPAEMGIEVDTRRGNLETEVVSS